jgi:hypothetical protein
VILPWNSAQNTLIIIPVPKIKLNRSSTLRERALRLRLEERHVPANKILRKDMLSRILEAMKDKWLHGQMEKKNRQRNDFDAQLQEIIEGKRTSLNDL